MMAIRSSFLNDGYSIILDSVSLTDVAKGITQLFELMIIIYGIEIPFEDIDVDKDLPEVYKLI